MKSLMQMYFIIKLKRRVGQIGKYLKNTIFQEIQLESIEKSI